MGMISVIGYFYIEIRMFSVFGFSSKWFYLRIITFRATEDCHFISGAGHTILSEKPVLIEFQSTMPKCTHLGQKSLIINWLNY